MQITIPDWIFSGPYWAGFGTAVVLFIVLVVWLAGNFNPFGR